MLKIRKGMVKLQYEKVPIFLAHAKLQNNSVLEKNRFSILELQTKNKIIHFLLLSNL